LSWDEFILLLLSSKTNLIERDVSILELNSEEAKILIDLLEKGRKSWSQHVLTQAS